MKKIACIKFAGLASGGTEKVLQNIAMILSKNNYQVDYYYTNAAPFLNHWFVHPDNDEGRKKLVESCGVNTIPVYVESKQADIVPYKWNNTDFWDLFDESKYDAIQTARGGYPEYPFNLLNKTKIVDGIHSDSGEDKDNIVKSILLSKWQAERWGRNGGNLNKSVIIPTLVTVPSKKIKSTLRKKLGIPEDDFVYGFHQRNDPNIFSPASLYAYSLVSGKNNHFILLGGSDRHRELARQMDLSNIHFLDFSSDSDLIHDFLGSIDVYTHARLDGEVCSGCIIEAMYHGKPVLSHPGTVSMGHLEQIEGCGYMAYSVEEYANKMYEIENSKDLYLDMSSRTYQNYKEKYSYSSIEKQILDLYQEVV